MISKLYLTPSCSKVNLPASFSCHAEADVLRRGQAELDECCAGGPELTALPFDGHRHAITLGALLGDFRVFPGVGDGCGQVSGLLDLPWSFLRLFAHLPDFFQRFLFGDLFLRLQIFFFGLLFFLLLGSAGFVNLGRGFLFLESFFLGRQSVQDGEAATLGGLAIREALDSRIGVVSVVEGDQFFHFCVLDVAEGLDGVGHFAILCFGRFRSGFSLSPR
ncbi:hypothetical protein WP1_141 [Pseudomonas phage WP1]